MFKPFQYNPIRCNSPLRDLTKKYTRPNLNQSLSPSSSTNKPVDKVLKQRRARKRLRTLLQQQADINQFLADENEILNVQQKSLLKLLITKDKQLESIAASLSCIGSPDTNVSISQQLAVQGSMAFNNLDKLYKKRKRDAFKQFESLKWNLHKETKINFGVHRLITFEYRKDVPYIVRAFNKIYEFGERKIKFIEILNKVLEGKLKEWIKVVKSFDEGLFQENKAREASLLRLQSLVLEKQSLQIIKTQALTKWRLKPMSKLFYQLVILENRVISSAFSRIQTYSYKKNEQIIIEQNLKSINQLKVFSKQFLSISSLCSVMNKGQNLLLQKKFSIWKQNPSKYQACHYLGSSLISLFRKRFNFLKPKFNPNLPFLLHSKLLLKLNNYFQFIKLNSAAVSQQFQTVQLTRKIQENQTTISQLSRQLRDLEQINSLIRQQKQQTLLKLQMKQDQCRNLTNKVAFHIEQLENCQEANKEERESIFRQNESAKAEVQTTNQLVKSLQDNIEILQGKIRSCQDEKRILSLQVSQLQTSLNKAQQLYQQSITEKSKIQGSEVEYRKQLISLTTTIDNLAQEKEILLSKLATASQESRIFKEKLGTSKASYDQLIDQISYFQQRQIQYQKQLTELQTQLDHEAQAKTTLAAEKHHQISLMKQQYKSTKQQLQQFKAELTQRESQIDKEKFQKLKRENKQLLIRFQQIQTQADQGKSTSSQLSSQVLKLNKQIADLKIEVKVQKEKQAHSNYEKNKIGAQFQKLQQDLRLLQQQRDKMLSSLKSQQVLQSSKAESQIRALKQYCFNLEQQLSTIQTVREQLNKYQQEIFEQREKKCDDQALIYQLQSELEECRYEALNSRQEVAKVCAQIQNYASILEAMEEKLQENEEKLRQAEEEKQQAIAEVKAVRQRYINIIASQEIQLTQLETNRIQRILASYIFNVNCFKSNQKQGIIKKCNLIYIFLQLYHIHQQAPRRAY